ncbi:MAG: DUF1028 domain-containing protein [Acidimicrobiia bacterium]
MTYSIIARDPATGAFGLAAQSHWFNVAQPVAWVRFGVGAVATQASADPSYGWRGLALMADGVDPPTALHDLSEADDGREQRQVAMLNASGVVAARTGDLCVAHAGHVTGDGWSVQGNLLASPFVVEAMAAGYEASRGSLVSRMLTALEAAERAGGDLRGRQSAVIRIVSGSAEPEAFADEAVDLRVCDHKNPLGEMRRLVSVDEAYREMERGHAAIDGNRPADALVHFETAVGPGHQDELQFWRAIGLVRLDRVDEAVNVFGRLVAAQPMYGELLDRVAVVDPVAVDLRDAWRR